MQKLPILAATLGLAVAYSSGVQAVDLQFNPVLDRMGIVDIANAGDGSGRLFLVEQAGLTLPVAEYDHTQGGVFDTAEPSPVQSPDGTIVLEFGNCNAGLVTYDITATGDQGVIPIERIALDNVPACEVMQ